MARNATELTPEQKEVENRHTRTMRRAAVAGTSSAEVQRSAAHTFNMVVRANGRGVYGMGGLAESEGTCIWLRERTGRTVNVAADADVENICGRKPRR